jgi:hypothetical protein
VFRIRIGFSADTDPGLGQTLPSQKLDFEMKNILYVGNMFLKTYLRRYKRHFSKAGNQVGC